MPKLTPRDVKALSILHTAMLIGQLLLAFIMLLLVYFKGTSFGILQPYSQQILFACAALCAAAYAASNYLFKRKLQQLNGFENTTTQQFNDYRAACILRWAIIEFPVLFSIIMFATTDDYLLLLLAAVMMLLFLTLRPTVSKVAADLNLSEEELQDNETGL